MSVFFGFDGLLGDFCKRVVRPKEGGSDCAVLLQSREENEDEQDDDENEALEDSTEFLWFSFTFLHQFFSYKQRPQAYEYLTTKTQQLQYPKL